MKSRQRRAVAVACLTVTALHAPSVAPFSQSRTSRRPSKLHVGTDVSSLLYQEQEKLLVQRGELEESLVTDASSLEASKVKVRGTGRAGGFAKSSSPRVGPDKAEGKPYAKILRKEGVIRVDKVLSEATADSLRDYLYDLRYKSESDVKEGKIQPIERFADVLLRHNRCDLTVPLGDEIVSTALYESMCKSPVGSIILSEFGHDATLHELSCLMSDSGSQRQCIHPDTPYIDGKKAVLYTCFIALQDVTLDMGPTTWLPRTNTKDAHEIFRDQSGAEKDDFISKTPAVLGTLSKGSAAIFDSRTLHCGTANRSDKSRALFYFSFKSPKLAGSTGNPASIRRELGDAKVTLGDLTSDLVGLDKGNECELIERLAALMR